jgi:hypothetical protein
MPLFTKIYFPLFHGINFNDMIATDLDEKTNKIGAATFCRQTHSPLAFPPSFCLTTRTEFLVLFTFTIQQGNVLWMNRWSCVFMNAYISYNRNGRDTI